MAKNKLKWNNLTNALDKISKNNVLDFADGAKEDLRSEVPKKTHNLERAQTVGELERTRDQDIVQIVTDEKKAPYGPHVFFPGISRRYSGNDWVSRAKAKTEKRYPKVKANIINDVNALSL